MNELSTLREERLLTITETAKYLRLSKSQVYVMIQQKKLPYIRLSERRIVVRETELKKWIEKQAVRSY